MDIGSLWFTQRSLKRSYQIEPLARTFKVEGYYFDPPIELAKCDDGEIEIINGHHRITALWLAGFKTLRREDYHLSYPIFPKGRFWQVKDLGSKTNLLGLIKNEQTPVWY